jgi:hypothetical protein
MDNGINNLLFLNIGSIEIKSRRQRMVKFAVLDVMNHDNSFGNTLLAGMNLQLINETCVRHLYIPCKRIVLMYTSK